MKQLKEPSQTSHIVTDELTLDDDELKALAKFLDALIEADFTLKKSKGPTSDD